MFVSSSAFADWDNGDLVMGIYNKDYAGDEIVLNLGDVSGLDFSENSNVVLGQVSDVSSWEDLRMEVFGYRVVTSQNVYTPYFATTRTGAPTVDPNAFQMWTGATQDLYSGYTFLDEDEDNIVIHPASGNSTTFGYNMDGNYFAPGSYAGLNLNYTHGQANLNSLDEGGSVQMYLYKFNTLTTLDPDDDGNADTPWIGVIEIKADGTIVLNPSVENNPPVASDDSFTVAEGGTATEADLDSGTTLLSNDTDDGDTLTVNTEVVIEPEHGILTLYEDGTFLYEHDGSEATTDSFVYEISDGQGGTDQATVSIIIKNRSGMPWLMLLLEDD